MAGDGKKVRIPEPFEIKRNESIKESIKEIEIANKKEQIFKLNEKMKF